MTRFRYARGRVQYARGARRAYVTRVCTSDTGYFLRTSEREREKGKGRGRNAGKDVCMHIDARARSAHVFSINLESFCTPVLRTQFTTALVLPDVVVRAPHRRFLRRPLVCPGTFFSGLLSRRADVTTAFPSSSPSLSGKRPPFSSFSRSSRLDRPCLSGAYEARGGCNCTRHTSPTGRARRRRRAARRGGCAF